jgi:hypothetical protein
MPTRPVTVNVEGVNLHLRIGAPADHGIKVDPATLSMTYYVSDDERENFELWLVGLNDHPLMPQIVRFAVNGLAQILREMDYPVPSAWKADAVDQLGWREISPGHNTLSLDTMSASTGSR